VTRQTGRRRSNVLDLSVCLFVRLSVFSPNLWTRQFEPILAQVVHGASTWHDQLGGQEVKAQGHVKPKIDLETWWRHYPRPPGSSRYNACLQVTGFNPFPRGVYSDTTQLNSTRRRVVDTFTAWTTVTYQWTDVVTQLPQFVGRVVINKKTRLTWLYAVQLGQLSWVELSCRYRQPSIAIQLNSTRRRVELSCVAVNIPSTGTLKPQSNGPLYSKTVIGTLAVDGTSRRGLGGLRLRPVPSSLYQM